MLGDHWGSLKRTKGRDVSIPVESRSGTVKAAGVLKQFFFKKDQTGAAGENFHVLRLSKVPKTAII